MKTLAVPFGPPCQKNSYLQICLQPGALSYEASQGGAPAGLVACHVFPRVSARRAGGQRHVFPKWYRRMLQSMFVLKGIHTSCCCLSSAALPLPGFPSCFPSSFAPPRSLPLLFSRPAPWLLSRHLLTSSASVKCIGASVFTTKCYKKRRNA